MSGQKAKDCPTHIVRLYSTHIVLPKLSKLISDPNWPHISGGDNNPKTLLICGFIFVKKILTSAIYPYVSGILGSRD